MNIYLILIQVLYEMAVDKGGDVLDHKLSIRDSGLGGVKRRTVCCTVKELREKRIEDMI